MFSALTFNIQNGEPWIGDTIEPATPDLEGTCRFLQNHPADIYFLQEVEQGHEGGGQKEPPPNYSRLKEALPGYHSVFGYPVVNPDELPFGLGLAIFSRWPLENFWREDLPAAEVMFEFGGRERKPSSRLLIGAEAVHPGGRLALMNTHLQAFFMINSTSDAHPCQREQVAAAMRRTQHPCLMGGDFNCSPEEGLLGQFESAGFRTVQNEVITWRRRPYILDHLFYNAGLRCLGCEVIPTESSDHHAVRAQFEFSR